jgi:hypothetical protein
MPSDHARTPQTRTKPVIFILHSLIIVCLTVAFLTGMRIAAATETSGVAGILSKWLPQGNVFYWHILTGMSILFITISYLGYIFLTGHTKRLRRIPHQALFSKENLLRQIIWLGLALVTGSATTGLWMYLGPGGNWQLLLSQIHYVFAWIFIIYTFIHVVSIATLGGIRRLSAIFIPRMTSIGSAFVIFIIAGSAAIIAYQFGNTPQASLMLHYHNRAVTLDGKADEKIWQRIPPTEVLTFKGQNSNAVPVEIRALHDGTFGYFLISWPDSTRSLKHLPLIKTKEGWKVIQTEAMHANENVYYEDKLAVMLSHSAQMAGAGTVHLGKAPLNRHPDSSGGRGLHYTTDGSYVDIWHWKAVRTGLSLGQADDNHFGPALPSQSEYKRFTAGYQKDPDCEHLLRWQGDDYHLKPECGGYVMNWKLYDDGIIQPRRLPRDVRSLQRMQAVDLDPEHSDSGQWWMAWEDTVRYSVAKDNLPEGTIIPSVLSLGRFTQGRAGVDAGAEWSAGRWTLELKRKLNSDNRYDLPIADGINFWVSVFNHSQTGHTYHLHPLKLQLQALPTSE